MEYSLWFTILISLCAPIHAQRFQSPADAARAMRKPGYGKKLFEPTVMDWSSTGMTSLDGIAEVPGIEQARIIRIVGNSISTLKAGTFDNPAFKNVLVLDLRNNNMSDIEPGALKGLENLQYFLLGSNDLTEFKPGTLTDLKSLRRLFIGNTPRMEYARTKTASPQAAKAYVKQVQKNLVFAAQAQLPPTAGIYTGAVTRHVIRAVVATLVAAGISATVAWAVFGGRPKEERIEMPGLGEGWEEFTAEELQEAREALPSAPVSAPKENSDAEEEESDDDEGGEISPSRAHELASIQEVPPQPLQPVPEGSSEEDLINQLNTLLQEDREQKRIFTKRIDDWYESQLVARLRAAEIKKQQSLSQEEKGEIENALLQKYQEGLHKGLATIEARRMPKIQDLNKQIDALRGAGKRQRPEKIKLRPWAEEGPH